MDCCCNVRVLRTNDSLYALAHEVIILNSASKAAVVSICQTAANQFTGTGIRCNAICPGIIETQMTKPAFDIADSRGNRDKIGHLNPLLRYGDPEEMASVALFLASDDSSYVNGQAIRAGEYCAC